MCNKRARKRFSAAVLRTESVSVCIKTRGRKNSPTRFAYDILFYNISVWKFFEAPDFKFQNISFLRDNRHIAPFIRNIRRWTDSVHPNRALCIRRACPDFFSESSPPREVPPPKKCRRGYLLFAQTILTLRMRRRRCKDKFRRRSNDRTSAERNSDQYPESYAERDRRP